MRNVKAVVASSALLVLMSMSYAMADSPTHMLQGEFAYTLRPPAGFTGLVPNPGPTFVITNGFQGVRTFNGDGTGNMRARIATVPISGPPQRTMSRGSKSELPTSRRTSGAF